MSKADGKTKRDLVEILETDCEDKEQITLLLERALALKAEKERVEAEYEEVKEDLGALQVLHGLEGGMRHNNIAFVISHRDGRVTVDATVFAQELVAAGVEPGVVKQAAATATKQGKGYYVKEVVDLNVKKAGGRKGGAGSEGWS